ncbi:MAG: hypothetical protein LUG16_06500 [Candidatus Gastranaerophilales bacterium]|nr:hypothetical protein [Candidatus Gastranaerophilales bacterium]
MAQIIENLHGRRSIRLNTNDIISIVREYQDKTRGAKTYEEIRKKLSGCELYLPEDIC